uniref:Uncharacterized protein n=1 Tax=Panagrolaimus sp. ES5 TaxID=591445 RepID=A0AC34FX32_9BILA
MTNVSCKLWITDVFNSYVWAPQTPLSRTSAIISQIYRCDAKELKLRDQEFKYTEYLFLSSKLEKLSLETTTVKYENGSIVPLKELVKNLLYIKYIQL